MPRFSIIVPVYNRIDEVSDLLKSLAAQATKSFEVIIVEDGSSEPCRSIVEKYTGIIDVKYFYKDNEGRSIARNHGMERASGDYFIFFDSDCVIPSTYFSVLTEILDKNPVDCFGGPDAAHESFTATQKAINYSMTSFLTTGGIRGGKVQMEKFTPRTFNMGFSKDVYKRVGGFREMFSEDIDMSTRIRNAGFSISLIREAFVYHKRRGNMRLFARQVYVFGMSRVTLKLLYPGSLKMVHLLPAAFAVGSVALVSLSILVSWLFILPLALYILAIFITALVSTRSLNTAFKSVPASLLQLGGYGAGFIRAYTTKILLGRGRDIEQEIEMRKGK